MFSVTRTMLGTVVLSITCDGGGGGGESGCGWGAGGVGAVVVVVVESTYLDTSLIIILCVIFE